MRKKIRNSKERKRWRRHMSIRNKVQGTPERPRVCVFRSKDHIYAQIIDDMSGVTLAAVSSLKIDSGKLKAPKAAASDEESGDKGKKEKGKKGGKGKKAERALSRRMLMAREVGRLLAEAAGSKGVSKIAFDRGGYLYHGRVAALAESARENGLKF